LKRLHINDYSDNIEIKHPTNPQAPPSQIAWSIHRDVPDEDETGLGTIYVTVCESFLNSSRYNYADGRQHRAATALECAPQVVRQAINMKNLVDKPEPNFLKPSQVTCLIFIPENAQRPGQPEQILQQRMDYDKDFKVIRVGEPSPVSREQLHPSIRETFDEIEQDMRRQVESVRDSREWVQGERSDFQCVVPDVSQSASVRITEVRSTSNAEQRLFILEDIRTDRTGDASLEMAAVRNSCMHNFCFEKGIKPSSGDWFWKDDQERETFHGLHVSYKRVQRPHAAYTSFDDPPDTQESLVDRWVDEPRTSVYKLEAKQSVALKAAVAEACQYLPEPQVRPAPQAQVVDKPTTLTNFVEPWRPQIELS